MVLWRAGLHVAAAFGGLSKFEQVKELKAGAEVAVATPGRMIDLVKMKACTMTRVTYLVLDEADRMFDMGFEGQVRGCQMIGASKCSAFGGSEREREVDSGLMAGQGVRVSGFIPFLVNSLLCVWCVQRCLPCT
jgi:hypothetical protein